MLTAPLPFDEAGRLERLRDLMILDSPPEPIFDSIARMASKVCGTPVALVSLIDEKRQWFKAKVGVDGVSETPRDIAFCAHALFDDTVFEVEDASLDSRFADSPLVVDRPHVRFYAGAPLILPGGERVGTLCVIDHVAGKLSAAQAETMRELAAMASQALTMRRELMERATRVRTDYDRRMAAEASETADLYNHAPCGYHSMDAEGRFVRINDTALRWLGCTRKEAIGLDLNPFLTEEGRAQRAVNFPRLLREGRVDDIRFELVSRTGERRHVILNSTAVTRPDGSFLMSRSVMFDVTELMQTKSALRRLAEEQQMILDTDLISLVKLRDRKVTWANRGIEELLGYPRGGLLGQMSRVLYADDETFERMGVESYAVMRSGGEFRKQVEFQRSDGKRIWIDLRAKAQRGVDNEFICMLMDITTLKDAERARLRGAALEAENRQLVETHRVKNLLLGNMSHELHTPLNAVIGYAHLLQSGSVPKESPKFGDFLGKIGTSGRQLLGLVDTLLNYARAEAGKLEFSLKAVDVGKVVQEVSDSLAAEIRQKQIALHIDVDPALGTVVIDELRLAQSVEHYLSNAIKFSHPGGRVGVQVLVENGTNFRVEVEDQGIGIADVDLPRLFGSFQQLSEGRTKAYGGAGLSLALTKHLVEAQGGSVGVRTRPGEGSTFWLVLPRDSGAAH